MAEGVIESGPGGEGEATAQGTPPVAPAPIGRAETVEETYARLGLTFTEVDGEGNEVAGDDAGEESADEGADDATGSADDADADEQDEASEPAATTDWVAVIRDAPQRINEVPAKERAAVIERLRQGDSQEFEQRLATAIRREREAVREEVIRMQQIESAVAEIDDLAENDPAAFKDWREQYPERAAAYFRFKADKTVETLPQTAQGSDPAQPYREAAAELLASVVDNDGVMEELRKTPGRYTPDAKGLKALTEDIARLTAAQSQTAQRRQDAIESRKRVPKADATPGANPRGVPDLKNMTKEQIAKLTPEQVAEAMAASR